MDLASCSFEGLISSLMRTCSGFCTQVAGGIRIRVGSNALHMQHMPSLGEAADPGYESYLSDVLPGALSALLHMRSI